VSYANDPDRIHITRLIFLMDLPSLVRLVTWSEKASCQLEVKETINVDKKLSFTRSKKKSIFKLDFIVNSFVIRLSNGWIDWYIS
jgi:hypothetical protein